MAGVTSTPAAIGRVGASAATADALGPDRFTREIRIAAGLTHPHILPLHDSGKTDGLLYYVMPFIDGERKGTTVGLAIGTLRHMSPEQANADPATDRRADLFAAGVIACEMLTGVSPFAAPKTAAVFAALMTQSPEHPSRIREGVPEALGDIVLWCLEKDPTDRPQNTAELLARLDAVLTPPSGVASAGLTAGGRGSLVTPGRLAAAVVLVGLAGFVGWRVLDRRAEVRWARQEALPQVLRLAEAGHLGEAAQLAFRVESVLGDEPVLEPIWQRVTTPIRVVTEPAGAQVSWRPYDAPDAAWMPLGTTPYESERFPVGTVRFRVALDGYDTVEVGRSFMSAEWLRLHGTTGVDYMSDPSYAVDLEMVATGSGPPGWCGSRAAAT